MKNFRCALISDIHLGYSQNTYDIVLEFFGRLAKEKIDVLFIAGDVISKEQKDFEKFFKLVRQFFPDIIVLFTFGNHDRWTYCNLDMPWDNGPFPENYAYFYSQRKKLPSYKRPISFGLLVSIQKKILDQYNITYLDGTSFNLSEKITILGFDGWYNETNLNYLGTNDYRHMPEMIESAPMHVYLKEKAYRDLDRILSIPTDDKTVVIMSHFPPFSSDAFDYKKNGFKSVQEATESSSYGRYCANPRYLEFIADKADFALFGHSHQQCDLIYSNCRILNAGIDENNIQVKKHQRRYDAPRYIVFEIKED